MYLDTKNDLVPQRLLEILQSITPDTESVSVLSRILVSKCFHVGSALPALRKLVASCKLAGSNRTKILIVDSLAVLLLAVLPHGIKIASGTIYCMSKNSWPNLYCNLLYHIKWVNTPWTYSIHILLYFIESHLIERYTVIFQRQDIAAVFKSWLDPDPVFIRFDLRSDSDPGFFFQLSRNPRKNVGSSSLGI